MKLLIFLAAVLFQGASQVGAIETNTTRVKVGIYYDTMCPDAAGFLIKQVYPLMKSPVGKYVNLLLVPYGTAEGHWDGSYSCRGDKNCKKEKVQGCVLKMHDESTALEFIHCSEKHRRKAGSDKSCAEKQKLDYEAISGCATGEMGKKYFVANGKITDSIKPPLDIVPLVVFNDNFEKNKRFDDNINLRAKVCKLIGEEFCSEGKS